MSFRIILPPQGDISHQAGVILQRYLSQVTRSEIPMCSASTETPSEATILVIGNSERNPLANRVGFYQDWTGIRPDGYALRTLRRGSQTFVVAAGCDAEGDLNAVFRLMRKAIVCGHRVSFADCDLVLSPFIKAREVIMGNAVPWDPFHVESEIPVNERVRTYDVLYDTPACQLNFADRTTDQAQGPKVALRRVVERYCLEAWSAERAKRYVLQMNASGFNSIQLYDEWETYLHSGCLTTRRQWREQILRMIRQARDLGNRVTLQTWGGKSWKQNGIRVISDWDDPLCDEPVVFPKPEPFSSPCWHDPTDRRAIEDHLHYLSGYISHVDHVISHYADPGGCNLNGCTIGTAVELMNHQVDVFRAVNPRIQATFNTWPLTSKVTGYRLENVHHRSTWNRTFSWWHFAQVVRRLHPEIMIANRRHERQVADCCRRWGRKYGIWDWYSSDQEITASLHVEAERLGRQFSSIADEASMDLEYYSVPNNCHGLSGATIYIAGQLLWTPRRDPFEILREFCQCVFGPKCAEAFYRGYEAVARIRNRDVEGDPAFDDSYLGAGTPDPRADAEQSGAALEALRNATPDPEWVSRIPMATKAEDLREDLMDHLTMIHQYSLFREALRKLLPKSRILPEEWKALPKVERLRVSGGMLEFRHAADILKTAGVYDSSP
jgi:hypothetical protein